MSHPAYPAPTRLIHWVMALFLIATIVAGFVMVQEGLARALQDRLFIFHKNIGVALLLLAIIRLAYRLRYPAPPLPSHMPSWQKRAAKLSHVGLYILIFLMPIAGYIRVRAGGFPIESLDALGAPGLVPRSDALAAAAKSVHYYGAIAIAALIAVHVAAAIHHAAKRDGVFARIWPPLGRSRS